MCVSNTPQIRNLICVTFTSVINFRRMILISVYFNYSTADHRQESINHPKTHVNGRPQQFQCQVVNTTATAARRHCNPQRIRNGTSFRAGPGNIGQGRRSSSRNNEYSVIIPCCIVPKQQQQQHNGTYHPVTLITKPIPVHHPHKPFIYYFHSLGALPIIAFHISNAPSSAVLIAILRLSVCRSVELSCGEAATLCRWGKSVNANNQPPWMLLLLLLLFLTDRLLAHN